MELKIGKYILYQRTEFSKMRLLDGKTKEDITKDNQSLLEEFVNDYNIQIRKPYNYFKLEDNTITKLNDPSAKNLFLPDYIKFIGVGAFKDSDFYRVYFPETMVCIESRAFYSCRFLEQIDIPDSVESIDSGAFQSCLELKSVTLPRKLEDIQQDTFRNCHSLSDVYMYDEIWGISSRAFSGCTNLTNIILPDSIEYIGKRVFDRTSKLENINIPQNLEAISDSPFGYSSIKSLTFNHDLKKLDLYSSDLIASSNINKLIIDRNVSVITPYAFKYSGEQITEIDYLGNKEEFDKLKKHNRDLFNYYLTNIKKINFIDPLLKNRDVEDISI